MSSCHCSSSSSAAPLMFLQFNLSLNSRFIVSSSYAAARRHHRRRLLKYSTTKPIIPTPAIFKLSDDGGLQITIKPPSDSLHHLETRINQFIDYGREALEDLKTAVTVNGDGRGVVISCRRSTVEFFLALIFSGVVFVVAFRSLFKFRRNGGEGVQVVYKRDRSLGGKEVAVGVGTRENDLKGSRISTPLSLGTGDDSFRKRRKGAVSLRRKQELLPQWWPQVVHAAGPRGETVNKEEYQRMVDQMIRVIMDRKMNGQDISANDIVELHHICKTYGVRASIDTENARDSLYRTSINFVLSYCESVSNISTSVLINGEDARDFVAGLAYSIGLESAHAARMVSAAVAARTRSKILQAWALEVQNKHSEALTELLKVCLIHRIFPPEESSPEMEMVARSLEKSLTVDQRESILNSFITICGKDADRSVMEALGLLSERL